MAAKPMTTETIALTEKKMDMTLDDIIKMSKNNTSKPKNPRISIRNQKVFYNAAHDKSVKAGRFMDTRSYLRQGVLARKRSNFQGNQFPFTNEAAKKAFVAPIQNRPVKLSRPFHLNKPRFGTQFIHKPSVNGGGFNVKKGMQGVGIGASKQKPQTLDSRFASMKEQRMMMNQQRIRVQTRIPWSRNRNFRN